MLFWLAAAGLMVWDRWSQIGWFALSDTDDNMRMMQVRAWLAGQGWFDLRQYRLNPPFGADIHWSRLVDLPIAGIMLALKPLVGGKIAEQAAVAIAPLLPMAVAMLALAGTVRRLVAPLAFPLAVGLVLCGTSVRGMWAPLRIDHHGWQLALLALTALALTDPKRARGGLILGLATALSLTIGLEMLILLALAGGLTVLMWVLDQREARRLAAYGASLAGGCAAGFLLFASDANRAAVCDALSPVWLSAMAAVGALAVLLGLIRTESPWLRLALAAAGAAATAAAFALLWPDCLGRPERVSPELQQLWLSHVREARPIYRQSWQAIGYSIGLPIGGLIGYALMIWRLRKVPLLPLRRSEPECGCPAHRALSAPSLLMQWLALALLAAAAAALLLWQTRAGPSAQLLAVPGATALVWWAGQQVQRIGNAFVTAGAVVLAFLLASGLALQLPSDLFKNQPTKPGNATNRANSRCPTLAALRPIARIPRGYVLTFVDLGPRLITVTHHDAVAGPYHRNGAQILAVHKFFRGSEANARATAARLGVDYVLICPNMSESTIYRSETPKGFYVTLASGKVPAWLERIRLPGNSPYRMWRIRR